MSEDTGQEKTQDATPKRREEARKKGQVPRSRELSAAAVLMTGGAALYAFGGRMASDLHGMMSRSLTLTRDEALTSAHVVPAVLKAGADGFLACVPVLGMIMLAALLSPLVLGGWNFSGDALAPKFERLSPLAGIKRMFSMNSIVELLKALAKFGVVAAVAVLVLWKDAPALLELGREPTAQAIGHAVKLSGKGFLLVATGMLLIAAIDVPFQIVQYLKKMKMSHQEIREEMKSSEGSPEIKGRIRQMQQQVARQRMMQDVPTADVIVTNPTHFAVAIRYDENRMRAPIVVAKGADVIAARIRELGSEHAVPIFEAPPLARVLYRNVDIGGEIPASLYVAVAQVLTYIFQLRTAQRSGMRPPPKPTVEVEE
jgi:flagellar biosynthetic protein FlhB